MAIIVFEGLDGSGKSTLAKKVASVLEAALIHFPDRTTPTGERIDAMLRGDASFDPVTFQALQCTNRLEHAYKLQTAGLSREYHLVCVRYWQSGWVYGQLDGLSQGWLNQIQSLFPAPAVSFLVDVPVDEALSRMAFRAQSPELYEKSRKKMEQAALLYRGLWRQSGRTAHPILDGMKTPDELVEDALSALPFDVYHAL